MKTGDRVVVITGKYKSRAGKFVKNCSSVFSDHCRIRLDLIGREREQKVIMILKSEISKKNEGNAN